MNRTRLVLGLSIVLLGLAAEPAVSRLLAEPMACVPADGAAFSAELSTIDAGQATFQTPSGPRTIPLAKLVRAGNLRSAGRGPLVILADGGIVAGQLMAIDKERLTVESDLFGRIQFPVDSLAGILFHPPGDMLRRDLLGDRIVQPTGDSDRLLLANGDEVAGTFQGLTEEGGIQLQTNLGRIVVAAQQARALVNNPTLRRRPTRSPAGSMAIWTGFADGSRLLAERLTLGASKPGSHDATVRITLPGGLTWTAAAEELVFLQPVGGEVVYLSDLKAQEYRHLAFLDLSWPYRNDRNVLGGQLRAGGRVHIKGIGMHSTSRLGYALDRPYRRFEAELAIDDQTDGRGSVVFRVYVDGQAKYTSPVIRGGQPPLPISIDLSGVKHLDLVVHWSDRADQSDHADWLDARLIR